MELTVELLCIFCSGNHLMVVPSQEIILCIQGEQVCSEVHDLGSSSSNCFPSNARILAIQTGRSL